MRWQLEGKVESRWEKSQPIYVPVRMMQDRRLVENTGEGKSFWSEVLE